MTRTRNLYILLCKVHNSYLSGSSWKLRCMEYTRCSQYYNYWKIKWNILKLLHRLTLRSFKGQRTAHYKKSFEYFDNWTPVNRTLHICLYLLFITSWPTLTAQNLCHFFFLSLTWNSEFTEFKPLAENQSLWLFYKWAGSGFKWPMIQKAFFSPFHHYLF